MEGKQQNNENGPVLKQNGKTCEENNVLETPFSELLTTYLGYTIILIVDSIWEILSMLTEKFLNYQSKPDHPGFVPMVYDGFKERIFVPRMYKRGLDCARRPLCSSPALEMDILLRSPVGKNRDLRITGEVSRVINLGSYNYLGFCQNEGPCTDAVEYATHTLGVGTCGSRQELGYLDKHKELDDLVAEYLGVEAAITIPTGFATNSMNLPALVEEECLIISDEFNHSSLIVGCRLSGATIRTFKHNCVKDLENKLRDAIAYKQPVTRRPWKKILIVVEGLYSLEGTILPLPEVIALKKKYKAYLYMDEAHSIGALGPKGKGVVDYFGEDPKDVDVLMGTFTKSFASMGGYIAGSKKLINHLKLKSHAAVYSSSMSPCTVQQVISSMRIIMGKDGGQQGKTLTKKLRSNTTYFRKKLLEMGFIVHGDDDSPIVPVMVYSFSKTVFFSRECLKNNIGVAIVSFPATPLTLSRIRFCISALHTKESLDKVLKVIDKLGDEARLKSPKRKSRSDGKVTLETDNPHVSKTEKLEYKSPETANTIKGKIAPMSSAT